MIDEASAEHFKHFALSLETALEKYTPVESKHLLERQKYLVDRLVDLENQFKKAVTEHRWGLNVYNDFITHICEEKKNILAARPFFRERQEVFTSRISVALKEKDAEALYKFHFNYQFVAFVIKKRKWWPKSDVRRLAKEIEQTRSELVEMNMPLAISRARIFYGRTPKAQLSFMDFVQIACEGLLSAVDKFVPPFSKVFRSVAIGRMVGYFIEQYSETLIHFYPSDKRKIYRANKAIHKHTDGVDFERLATEVNAGVDGAHTTAAELADLMSAASVVSSNTAATHPSDSFMEEMQTTETRFAAPEETRPDVALERSEAQEKMFKCISRLSVFERKILELKGIEL